jgi:hypothetical protein
MWFDGGRRADAVIRLLALTCVSPVEKEVSTAGVVVY